MNALKTEKPATPKKTYAKTYRHYTTISDALNKRLTEYCRKKGLKDSDVLKIALNDYLTLNNF